MGLFSFLKSIFNNPVRLLPRQFRFLIDDFGFHVDDSEVSESFDNFWVHLTNGAINVCVSRDRGYLAAEVSSLAAPYEWLPLFHLRQIVLRRDPTEEVTFDEEAEFLRLNYLTVVDLLSAAKLKNTHDRVLQLGRDRSNKLFPGSIREPHRKNSGDP